MGMLRTLFTKTLASGEYSRITNELAATVVSEARVALSRDGNDNPSQDELQDRADLLYTAGARAFGHGILERKDMYVAIARKVGR